MPAFLTLVPTFGVGTIKKFLGPVFAKELSDGAKWFRTSEYFFRSIMIK
jgi:hypothetical protein